MKRHFLLVIGSFVVLTGVFLKIQHIGHMANGFLLTGMLIELIGVIVMLKSPAKKEGQQLTDPV